jgi:hypothetical protein
MCPCDYPPPHRDREAQALLNEILGMGTGADHPLNFHLAKVCSLVIHTYQMTQCCIRSASDAHVVIWCCI